MVDYRVDGHLAVLEVNNPPVNALSSHVREGFDVGFKKAHADNNVRAIIIIGKGRTFPSGADIKEFGKPSGVSGVGLLSDIFADRGKPVICAIHGTCLGGGLEVALFSHYRIADKNARVGFPEVNIGIVPGAQGTQRLPRLTGLEVAIDMITSGRHVRAEEAMKYGIIDKIVDGNLLSEAKKFAMSVIGKPLEPRRLSKATVKGKENVDRISEEAMAHVKRKYKGMIAPIYCVKSVCNAARLPFEEGVAEEARIFRELVVSSQAFSLRHAFFSERTAPRWKIQSGASFSNTKPLPIKSAAVIGAGTMGSGIAICLLRVGISVILVEQNSKMLDKGLKSIDNVLFQSVKLKRLTLAQRQKAMSILRGTVSMDALKDVDVVIEAVFENLALKQKVFSQLDKICKPQAVLCSNTSTLDIDKIASATTRPEKVIGMHFFAPAYIMRLLENVYGAKTSPETIATAMDLGKKIGKVPVLVRTCDGFVGNRMNGKMGSEAAFLLEEGSLPEEVDQVFEDFGMPMGLFKVGDLSGLDIGWHIRQERAKERGLTLTLQTRFLNAERYSSLSDKLHKAGRLGQKTGKGWYRYEKPYAKKAFPDDEVKQLILDHSKSVGIERRQITPQEIIERCLYSAINEGFKILEEGVAEKPEDIDIIWLFGFGFPRYRGGPMYYASQVGLKNVYDRICHYYDEFPSSSYWVPSELLKKLASSGKEVPMNKWGEFGRSRL